MSATNQRRLGKRIRLAARIIGLVVSAFFFMMLAGDAVMSIQAEGFKGISAEGIIFAFVPIAIALSSFIISWWLERVGGTLLILAYLLLSSAPTIHALYYGRGLHFYAGMWLYTLPFLVSGILFLISSWLSRKADRAEPTANL